MLKRCIFFLIMCVCLVGFSCAKPKTALSDKAREVQPVHNTDTGSAPDSVPNPEAPRIEALESILSELSIPTKDLIMKDALSFLHELDSLVANDTDYLLTLVDKKHYLAETYVPEDLVPLKQNDAYNISRNDLSLRVPVEKALREMALGAKNDGVTLLVSSSYRSFNYQKTVYERNVKQMGQAAADRESARPGTSQHQLGTAIDFGSITDEFAETKQGKWLTVNAHRYGFSLSFPDGYEDVTGYRWECWHYRYIGQAAAAFQQKWFGDIQQHMLEVIDAAERKGLLGNR